MLNTGNKVRFILTTAEGPNPLPSDILTGSASVTWSHSQPATHKAPVRSGSALAAPLLSLRKALAATFISLSGAMIATDFRPLSFSGPGWGLQYKRHSFHRLLVMNITIWHGSRSNMHRRQVSELR